MRNEGYKMVELNQVTTFLSLYTISVSLSKFGFGRAEWVISGE